MRQLQLLDIHHNSVQDLAPLQHLTSLVIINAAANNIQQLPTLTALTQLTELNLRMNNIIISSSTNSSSTDTTAGAPIFPMSLRRLSLAHNQIPALSDLQSLRQLPCLEDICLDGNPLTAVFARQACTARGAAGNNAYREAVMAYCPPSLLMLDMKPVRVKCFGRRVFVLFPSCVSLLHASVAAIYRARVAVALLLPSRLLLLL